MSDPVNRLGVVKVPIGLVLRLTSTKGLSGCRLDGLTSLGYSGVVKNLQPPFPSSPCDVGPFRLGEWLVEPGLNRVSRGDSIQQIEPRVMHVLCCLAVAPGRVVSRAALLDAVWSKAVVNEEALTHAISHLRRVFGDEAKRPKLIQTIHKTGYRIVQPAKWLSPDEAARLHLGEADTDPYGPLGHAEAAPAGVAETATVELAPAAQVQGAAESQPAAPETVPPTAGPALPAQPTARHARPAPRLPRHAVGLALACLAIVIVVVSLVATRPGWRPAAVKKPAALGEVPFTTYPGREAYPAISRDGTRVAFAWKESEDGNYDLYVKQRNGDTPLRLTATEENECLPAWSPDGTEIAYGVISATGISINVVPAIGGAPRRVVMASRTLSGLDWSPDGTLLAYGTEGSTEVSTEGGAAYGAVGPLTIFLCPIATGEARPLTEPIPMSRGDFRPAFSPDGGHLAFVRSDLANLHDIYLVPVSGGETERLTHSFQYLSGLDWTPDGKSLVFSSAPGQIGDSRLWRLSVGDGSRAWLPIGAHHPTRLSIAQHGGLVVEVSTESSDIVRVRVDSPDLAPEPIARSTQHDFSPQYSPGGHFITFVSTRSGSPQVWVCDVDGANARQVTQFDDARIWNPCWSHDERRVAFSAATGSVAGLYVADIETRRVQCVSEPGQHHIVLGWSRDGRSLYCKTDREGRWWVRRVPLDGGESVDIMEKDAFRLAEAIDGSGLIFSRSDISSIWSVALDGSDETSLVGGPHMVVPRGWREVEQGIYFFVMDVESETPGAVSLCFKDRSTGETRILATHTAFASSNLDVSPAGDYVITDRLEHLGSDLVLVEEFR